MRTGTTVGERGRGPRARALGVAALAWVAAACPSSSGGPAASHGGGGPVPVTVAAARIDSVPDVLHAVGTVVPTRTVSIRARVTGLLASVDFREGADVSQGDPLFTLDVAPFKVALARAQAAQRRDDALARQARATVDEREADLVHAEAQVRRYEEMRARGAATEEILEQMKTARDTAKAAVDAARAAVGAARAAVAADKAAIDAAEIDLGYTSITAPMDGRTGLVKADPGNLVKANDQELTTLVALEPIEASFAVPATHLAAVTAALAKGPVPVKATAGERAADGELTFVDNEVDQATGTLALKATFPNKDRSLWPGELVEVTLRLGTIEHAVVVPKGALQSSQKGQLVFVVKADETVESRSVEVGRDLGEEVTIASGLEGNETVVTDGQLRLVPGAKIAVKSGRRGVGDATP